MDDEKSAPVNKIHHGHETDSLTIIHG